MKHVYAVLVLALVLVFAFGSVASAGVLRGEDYDRPADESFDEGEPDEDHPWGGDRIIGEDEGDDRTDDKVVVSLTSSDYLFIDLWLSRLYQLFIYDEPVLTATVEYEARSMPEKSYRVPRPASPVTSVSVTADRKVVTR